MSNKESHKVFHHALKILPDVCIGCTHCMTVCPTQAIRVREGLARIFEDRCVDCGECYKVCPVSAIIIEQDDFEEIYRYPVRVAMLPSVLIGQFPSRIPAKQVYGALREMGFTHVFEIDSVVDLVQQGYELFRKEHPDLKPLISTFCPAIVRLIQVRFPSLVDHLVRVKPPMDLAAIHFKEVLTEQGHSPESIGLFYVTPCAAKIASVKSPVGDTLSPINGVINMEYLYNRLLQLITNQDIKEADQDSDLLNERGILWSLTRGESVHQKGRSLAIDGMNNVTEFLERLEETEDSNLDFLELRACDESCAGGVLISGNRFLTVERLNSRAETFRREGTGKAGSVYTEWTYVTETHNLGPIEARSMLVLDADRIKAMQKMRKVEDLLKVLPGIDCGACGSPTCRALAEDIVQERAGISWCIFLQEVQLKNGKLTLEEADRINAGIWGSDRQNRSQK